MDRTNVDTDQIIPKQFLKRVERSGFGEFLFFDWRFDDEGNLQDDFELNHPSVEGASVLLARSNFGSGSSREHAPWALEDYGFRILVAPSFADIFYNNCFKNGILPVTLASEVVDELFERAAKHESYRLSADLDKGVIYDEHGFEQSFEIDPHRRHCLLNGLDDIGLTLAHEGKIATFEADRGYEADS